VNQEQVQKGKLALQTYQDRPVGCPPDPDLSDMTKEERATRRDTIGRLKELTKKAQKGDGKAVPEIWEILEQSPDLAWRFTDVGRVAEWGLIEKITKEKDLGSKEMISFQLKSMREDLAGSSPSPLERLLAERVVASWLQVQLFEGLYTQNIGKLTIKQADYYQKRLDRAHRRQLSAIKALAQIRKLCPAVQINIAEKQINTTG
jgi:hypothetical protein